MERFDLPGMLAQELRKSRIDEMVTRQLVKAIRLLGGDIRDAAAISLVDNLHVLYPIFPTVAIVLRALLPDLVPQVSARIFEAIRLQIAEGSHIMKVPVNLSYAVRLLAQDPSEASETVLNSVFENASDDMVLRRDVILAMTYHRADYWLSMRLPRFATSTRWERKAILASSYVLGDEGDHWRDDIRKRGQLNPEEQKFLEWLGQKNNGRAWTPPV